MKQPLITNFLNQTVNHTLEDNPPAEFVRASAAVLTNNNGHYWAVLPNFPDFILGTLDLYKDNNEDNWLNHINVLDQCQHMGIGTKLMRKAIEDFGHIYASNSLDEPGGDDDTRHLSHEGAGLVNSLIARGIMQANWFREPVI